MPLRRGFWVKGLSICANRAFGDSTIGAMDAIIKTIKQQDACEET